MFPARFYRCSGHLSQEKKKEIPQSLHPDWLIVHFRLFALFHLQLQRPFLSMGLGSFGENYGDRAMEMIGWQ